MHYLQPYEDLPGIQGVDECLSSGPQWISIDPSLDALHSEQDYSATHAWNIQQRLMSIQQSVNGYGRISPLQIPEEHFSRVGLHSPWNSQPDVYRHMRTVSPGCALGINSATDSSTSDEALSPDTARHYPSLSRLPSHPYCPAGMESSYTTGNGSWMAQPLYASNEHASSPYPASDHSACNLKDLQYSHDVEEIEEERPAATGPPVHLHQPEEVAFAEDEGYGRSIGDEESTKESEDEDDDEPPQASDVDSEYSPSSSHRRKTSMLTPSRNGPRSRDTPRRTRSLNTTTSPILDVSSRITKPGHNTHHRRTTSNGTSNGKRATKSFPCTFSAYGCASVFGSKNEWKRHVASQHLQLGFWRCDVGACDPDHNASSAGRGNGNGNGNGNKAKTYNDFNRKDLFTQHHRRMHVPFNSKYEQASKEERERFERSMDAVRERCWVVRRQKPRVCGCTVRDCGRVFEGENAWEERMEHVGKHFERGEGVHEQGEDVYLTRWAVGEGLVSDLGLQGRWLVGMEPVEGGGDGGARRGRRAVAGRGEQDEDE